MGTRTVKERMLDLFTTNKWHDRVFKLLNLDGTEELVFAHNIVLASSSPVFEALCFGPLAAENPVEIPDIDPVAFKMMLKFLYTDCVEFDSVETACSVLYASKKYFINSLAGLAVTFILSNINERNCVYVYNCARLVQEEILMRGSWSYLCSHLDDVLNFITYESLSDDLVRNLVNAEALNGGENILYKICLIWAEGKCDNCNLEKNGENLRKVLIEADIFNKIRWCTLTLEEFEQGPKNSGILTNEEMKFISESIMIYSLTNLRKEETEIILRFKWRHFGSDCLPENKPYYISEDQWKIFKTPMNGSDELFKDTKKLFSSRSGISYSMTERKKIQLKKYCCHRFTIGMKPEVTLPDKLKTITRITANKSVKMSAICFASKVLPFSMYTKNTRNVVSDEEPFYTEKLFIRISDSSDNNLFITSFSKNVRFGSEFRIQLGVPVTLQWQREYKIEVHFLNSLENYNFCLRSSISKNPSGLSLEFKDEANVAPDGAFVQVDNMSFISGLELLL